MGSMPPRSARSWTRSAMPSCAARRRCRRTRNSSIGTLRRRSPRAATRSSAALRGGSGIRSFLARRRRVPKLALHRQPVAVVEQLVHVSRVEHRMLAGGKVVADIGQVEVDVVLMSGAVDAVDVADALGLDERSDGAAADAERPPWRFGPLRLE